MIKNKKFMIKNKSGLEKWLDNHNHEMELVRTLVAIAVLIFQLVILWKIMG